MRYLAVSIDTKDKKVLVVGGGKVAYRKVKVLVKTDFTIDIVSKDFVDDFKSLETNPKISFIWKDLDENFILEAYDYLIIASSDKNLNESLEDQAKQKKIPFLNASTSENSDFIMNKIISQEDLSISLSTGGKNPGLLGILAGKIEELLADLDYEKITELNKIRQDLVARGEKNIGQTIRDLYSKPLDQIKKYGEENCK